MKKILFLVGLVVYGFCCSAKDAITYSMANGRFGDCALAYMKSWILAQNNNMDFYYVPFDQSHLFSLHSLEQQWSDEVILAYEKSENIKNENQINIQEKESILYISNFFMYMPSLSKNSLSHSYKFNDYGNTNMNDLCEYALVNKEFSDAMKKRFRPADESLKIDLPQDRVSVALHIRRPSGPDKRLISDQLFDNSQTLIKTERPRGDYQDLWNTDKFPPLQYYIDQLKFLSTLLDNLPLYVYIFTDFYDPLALKEVFEKESGGLDICFDCREKDNSWTKNVAEDIWAMSQFECLIRSCSHFSAISQLLGSHRCIVRPGSWYWSNNKLVVDKVFVIKRDFLNKKVEYFIHSDKESDQKQYIPLL